jgi:hypothetical protein
MVQLDSAGEPVRLFAEAETKPVSESLFVCGNFGASPSGAISDIFPD